MPQPSFVINDVAYSHHQIVSGNVNVSTNFEKSTFDFCQAWLSGQEQFKLSTSGSTGIPKEIIFSRDQLIASAKMTQTALSLKPGDTALVCLDTKYVAGQMMLVRSFIVGMNVIAVNPVANPLSAVRQNQKIDFAAFVPYQLQAILDTTPANLENVGVALIGGAPVNASTKKKIMNSNCQLYATYGMTETISHIALMKLNGTDNEASFNALEGVSIKLDDRGCLVINANFLNQPVVTNDLVQLISGHQFNWLGRWDNIINTGGVKVSPEKIENQLDTLFEELSLSNRFFIAPFPDPQLGEKVCLIVEGESLSLRVVEKLREVMKSKLSKYEAPKEIRFVRSFEETNTGKINRTKTINLFPI